MAILRYKEMSDSQFDIVGRDEEPLATVQRGDDDLWRILARPSWVQHGDLSFGPFSTSEEAFEELGAVAADQS